MFKNSLRNVNILGSMENPIFILINFDNHSINTSVRFNWACIGTCCTFTSSVIYIVHVYKEQQNYSNVKNNTFI